MIILVYMNMVPYGSLARRGRVLEGRQADEVIPARSASGHAITISAWPRIRYRQLRRDTDLPGSIRKLGKMNASEGRQGPAPECPGEVFSDLNFTASRLSLFGPSGVGKPLRQNATGEVHDGDRPKWGPADFTLTTSSACPD
jgi:hypothetical protein